MVPGPAQEALYSGGRHLRFSDELLRGSLKKSKADASEATSRCVYLKCDPGAPTSGHMNAGRQPSFSGGGFQMLHLLN